MFDNLQSGGFYDVLCLKRFISQLQVHQVTKLIKSASHKKVKMYIKMQIKNV